jgi:hypothetical protein
LKVFDDQIATPNPSTVDCGPFTQASTKVIKMLGDPGSRVAPLGHLAAKRPAAGEQKFLVPAK